MKQLSFGFFLVFVLLLHVTAGLTIYSKYLPDFDEFKVMSLFGERSYGYKLISEKV